MAREAYHHGDLRRALLAAAAALVARDGATGLSLRQVAQQAGVSPAAPYAHFPDEEAVLAAVAADGFRALGAACREATAAAHDDRGKRLRAVGRAYVGFALDRPHLYRLMFGPVIPHFADHPDLAAASGAAYEAIAGLQPGTTPAAAGPGPAAATGAWAYVHGLAMLLIDGRIAGVPADPAGRAAYVDAALDLLRHGLV